jgi:Ca2+-binding RTX toxin-like protein
MLDFARGGCDTLISGTGNDDMWGDAQVMLGNAQGGRALHTVSALSRRVQNWTALLNK